MRVAILTGLGWAISSGQDLTGFSPGETDLGDAMEREYRLVVMRLLDYPKATMAALNGPAFDAAVNIALACDIAVASESSAPEQSFIKIGLVPDVGGTWLLPRIVGLKRALALTLTGDRMPVREAQSMGLIYRVFADVDFAAEKRALTEKLASLSPAACQLTKDGLRASLDRDMDQQLRIEAGLQRQAGMTREFRDAIAVFRATRGASGPGSR